MNNKLKKENKYNMIGIIAEFNPLHKGHIFLLKEAKKYANHICVALSSNITQRGDFASFDSSKRATCAIIEGADIIIEIPHIFCMSSAEFYAEGAVKILKEAGCDSIIFGSEFTDNISFKKIVKELEKKENKLRIYNEMKNGSSYKKACINIFKNNIDFLNILNSPNSTLAIEYIKACKKYNLDYIIIKRNGNYFDNELNGDFSSANAIRIAIKNKIDFSLIPISKSFNKLDFFDIEKQYFYALKYKILIENLDKIYDIKEGINNLIKKTIINSIDINTFLNEVSNKRYSKSKILRICSHIFFNILESDAEYLKKNIEYIKVLAIKKEALKLLSKSNLFITKYSDLVSRNLIEKKQYILQNKVDCAFYTFSNQTIMYKNMVIID